MSRYLGLSSSINMNQKSGKKLREYLVLSITIVLLAVFLNLGLAPTSARVTVKREEVSSPSIPQPETRDVTQLVSQGKDYYQSGKFLEAINVWQEAAEILSAQGDTLNQGMILSNLALAHQQLGQWEEANRQISTSLSLLQKRSPGSNREHWQILAQALNTQGSLQLAQGQTEQALSTWQQARSSYQQAADEAGILRSSLNQAQALKTLGFYRRARQILEQVEQQWQTQPDSRLKAAGLNNLGNILRLIGYLDESEQILQQSLAIAQDFQSPSDINAALFSLGNTARARQQIGPAIDFYQQAVATAQSPLARFEAQANQLSLLLETQQFTGARQLWPQVLEQAASLPASRAAIYAQFNLAQTLYRFRQMDRPTDPSLVPSPSDIAPLLRTTLQQAKDLGDRQAQSYGLGYLGQLEEQQQQWAQAQALTEQALELAQSLNASHISYRWLWQLGRLYKAQGETEKAIAAYTEAVTILESLRQDIAVINPDLQFSFRDGIEPVYRQFVELLTENPASESTGLKILSQPNPGNLEQARQAIESLQLAELDNFFQQACLEANPVAIDQIDKSAAVIYPIILPNQLEVIVRLPGKPLRHYSTPLAAGQLDRTLQQLEQALYRDPIRRRRFTTSSLLPQAQRLYDWLLRPVETEIAESGVETLVFVLDGPLRNIPMAVLHDGQQYLEQTYTIALTPGLQLLEPKLVSPTERRVLSAGLTEGRIEGGTNFPPLDKVTLELAQIQSKIPSVVLLDRDFTKQALQEKIATSSFSIVHLATHGQFSSKAEETFILTGDGRINVNELDKILQPTRQRGRDSLELLVLSACQTAAGDNRATLGLAGIAIQSGASSTLATLWPVSDEATAFLMSQFYSALADSSLTKAEALRQAQQALMVQPKFQHPFFWASYTLIGNWT
ncbi:MAG: CHAT domain-containing protein [Xenococcaceae cyanobacterium MO_234.B1]|nr:CHAT domain-containing protein [Xenococcaceae cyanobacterium MO_234.B1]